MTVPLHRLADTLSAYMKCVPPTGRGIHDSVILLLRYGLNDSFLSSAHFTQLKPTAVTPAVYPIKRFSFQEVEGEKFRSEIVNKVAWSPKFNKKIKKKNEFLLSLYLVEMQCIPSQKN